MPEDIGRALNARKKRLRPTDFEGESFISLGHSSVSRFRIDRVFAEHSVRRVMRIETPLSEIACSLAGSGAGVTLCDPFTATEYATRGIVVRPFEPRVDFEFAALYAAQRTLPPVAREFIAAVQKAGGDASANYSSMEGFVAAKVFAEGVRRAGRNLTRDGFISAVQGMQNLQLGGFTVDFGPKKHTGSRFVELTMLTEDGRVRR